MVTGFTLQTCWLNPDTNDDWLECTVSSKCLGRHPLLGESQLVVHNYRTVFQNSSTFSLQRSLTSAECCAFLCCFRDQVGVYHWCFIFSSVVITTIHHLRALVIHLSRQRAEPLPSSFCSSILTNTISGVRPTFFHSAYCAAADDVADVDDRSALLTLPPALYGRRPSLSVSLRWMSWILFPTLFTDLLRSHDLQMRRFSLTIFSPFAHRKWNTN